MLIAEHQYYLDLEGSGMTVMDIKTNTALTPEQVQLAHAFRHTTVANLRLSQGDCAYPVISLHYDMVETAVRCLGITGPAREIFVKLAELPQDVVDFLK